MGKLEQQQDLQQQQQIEETSASTLLCQQCSVGLNRIANEFNFKCVFVLILTLSVFLSAIFWVLPRHSVKSGFDATDAIKISATVQVYFRLPKPVSLLIPHIERLEYDIFDEIGVPRTKVAILSMHKHGPYNYTYVMFGVLSDQTNNNPIDPVSLSVLRSSLVELFLKQSNLTLTTSIFGQPDLFEILTCPGGITVIPARSASIWQIPQVLFNFTLYNSVYDIQENFVEFKKQLKRGLHLRNYENVYVQITNKEGSTIDPPVTVQASVMSDLGGLLPQRLKQLAQTISHSPPAKNLGLNNTIFGKVKGISLSSYLNGTLHSPTPAPSPSPVLNEYAKPSPSYPPPPISYHIPPTSYPTPSPCINCYVSSPPDDKYPPHVSSPKSEPYPPNNAPAPSMAVAPPPLPCPHHVSPSSSPAPHIDPVAPSVSPPPRSARPYLSPMAPSSQLSPKLSPIPSISYGSRTGQDHGSSSKGSMPPSPSLSPLSALSQKSFAVGLLYKEIWMFSFSTVLIVHLLC